MFYNETQYVAAGVDSVAHRHKLVYGWETLHTYNNNNNSSCLYISQCDMSMTIRNGTDSSTGNLPSFNNMDSLQRNLTSDPYYCPQVTLSV